MREWGIGSRVTEALLRGELMKGCTQSLSFVCSASSNSIIELGVV